MIVGWSSVPWQKVSLSQSGRLKKKSGKVERSWVRCFVRLYCWRGGLKGARYWYVSEEKRYTLEKSQSQPAKCQPKFTFKFSGYGSSYLTLTHGRSYQSWREYQATGCWGCWRYGVRWLRWMRGLRWLRWVRWLNKYFSGDWGRFLCVIWGFGLLFLGFCCDDENVWSVCVPMASVQTLLKKVSVADDESTYDEFVSPRPPSRPFFFKF